MRELTTIETEQAGGGIIAQALTFLGGIIGSYLGSYAYEESGGAEGINNAISDVADAYMDTVATQHQTCRKTGLGCSMM